MNPKWVLVLDDGSTWETVDGRSNALVVQVSPEEHDRLERGHPAGDVLHGRTGTRVMALLADHLLGLAST